MSDCPGQERCPLVTRHCKACGRDVPGEEWVWADLFRQWTPEAKPIRGIRGEYQHRNDGLPCGPLGEATCPSGCGAK